MGNMTQQLGQQFRFDPSGSSPIRKFTAFGLAAAFICAGMALRARADSIPVQILDPNLQVTVAVSGFTQPIGVVFLSATDMLVLGCLLYTSDAADVRSS